MLRSVYERIRRKKNLSQGSGRNAYQSGKRVEAGESPEVVIKALGLTCPRIYEWIAKYREGGIEAFRRRKAPGKTPKLAGHQLMKMRQTVAFVMSELQGSLGYALEVPYPTSPRSKCDVVLSNPELWSIEFKMLRMMGDNGKPNDNILMHILSPYPEHRSALTDTEKLVRSGLPGRKAVVIYGYDYSQWPMEPAILAFETLARTVVRLGLRFEAETGSLVHPVHRSGKVFGWEIEER